MEAMGMIADVVRFGDVEFEGDLFGQEESALDVFHLIPVRGAVLAAHRNMVPSRASGGYDTDKGSVDGRKKEEAPASIISDGAELPYDIGGRVSMLVKLIKITHKRSDAIKVGYINL
jgi:hypothetical protein